MVPGSAEHVRDIFRGALMTSCIDFVEARVTLAIDGWLRKYGGWFFDQQDLGYEEFWARELEGMLCDDSTPIPDEVGPILLQIMGCETLEEYHFEARLAIIALAIAQPM